MGKLRNARTQVLGVGHIPDDCVDRHLLDSFKKVVWSVERSIFEFEKKICAQTCLYEDMLNQLCVFYGSQNGAAFADLENRFDAVPKTYRSLGASRLGPIKMRLKSILARIENFESRLVERDKIFFSKTHYEQKIANLSESDDPLKVDRNIAKRAAAVTKFAEAETVVAQVGEFLSNRFSSLEGILEMYARFLGDYHSQIAGQLNGCLN